MYCCCFVRYLFFCFASLPLPHAFSLVIYIFCFFQVRHLGLRHTLLAFPTLCACTVVVVMILPKPEVGRNSQLSSCVTTRTGFDLALTNSDLPHCAKVIFFVLILIKAFSYSLNNPCKEMLYQPTSDTVSSCVTFSCSLLEIYLFFYCLGGVV